MSLRSNSAAPKSVPQPEVIQPITFSLVGSGSSDANADPRRFDLASLDGYHEGLLKWELMIACGVGATPTAPGASTTFSLFWAFSDREIYPTDAPAMLSTSESSLVCNLPNATATRASGTLTFSGVPAADGTVTIDGVVYTLRAAVAGPRDVKIGASAAATATNMINAINDSGGTVGTDYGSGGAPHPTVEASSGGSGVVTVTAIEYGSAASLIATSETATNTAWGGSTLVNGSVDGLRIYATDAFLHGGRYLYAWYDRTAFDANAQINVFADLVRI